jgi:hypothetical protein
MNASTLPPTAAELAAVAAFESDVRAAGEPRARLRNVLRRVTPVPAPAAIEAPATAGTARAR